jgi:hypothetical protein
MIVFEAQQVVLPPALRRRRSLSAAVHAVLGLTPAARPRLLGVFERARFTAASLLALAVTTATLAGSRAHSAHLMTLSASTNLHNLTAHPLDVLVASAFWLSSVWMFAPIAAGLVLVVGTAERLLGSMRTVLVFVIGHVGATLVTVAGVAVGVAHGWLPTSLTYAIDVGPSYGLAAVGAALIARTANARRRHAAALLVVALVLVVLVDRTFTDVGHLVAALLAFLAARVGLVSGVSPVSRDGGQDRGAELVAPVGQRRLVVQPEPARRQRHRVEVAHVCDGLVPLRGQRSGRTCRNSEPGALGEVLLLARPTVVGRTPVRQHGGDASPAGVPRVRPPG